MKEKILLAHTKYDTKVAALLLELSQYSDERLNRRPADGGWSALQTAMHLVLVEENSMGYIQKKLGYGATFEAAGLKARWRTFWLLFALYLPVKFKAPKTSSGDNLPSHNAFADVNDRWRAVRAVWTDFYAQMPLMLVDRAVFKHPRVGKIGWLQMQDFFEAHFDRHLIQIRRALV